MSLSDLQSEIERRRQQPPQPQFTPEMIDALDMMNKVYSMTIGMAQRLPDPGSLEWTAIFAPDKKPGMFASAKEVVTWKVGQEWKKLTPNQHTEVEREYQLDQQMRVANIPGWGVGGIQRVKEMVPVAGATLVHSAADIPNQLYQRLRYGPQFGKYEEEFKAPPALYDLPYSLFADPSKPQKGEGLFKREVKVGIAKEMLLPWLTAFTGETGVGEDPVKAKGIVQRWAKDGLITPETAEEVMSFRTLGEYYKETPELAVLDVLLIGAPLAKVPLAGVSKLGKFGRAVNAGRKFLKEAEFAKGAPLSQATKAGFRQVSTALEAYRRGLAKWDEVMDSTAVNQWLWESTDVNSKLLLDYGPGALVEPTTFAGRAITGAAKILERAPLKFGAVTIPREYSANPAFFALQKTTEKLRSSYAPADTVMGWTERLVGLAPEQRMVDYFVRTLPQEALPAVRPIADKLRAATKKIPRDEWDAFVDALEATTPTGKRIPFEPGAPVTGPYLSLIHI